MSVFYKKINEKIIKLGNMINKCKQELLNKCEILLSITEQNRIDIDQSLNFLNIQIKNLETK